MQRVTVLIWMFTAIVSLSSRAESQFVNPLPNGPFQFNESNPIGLGAIDHKAFYCYWPAWSVSQPAVTAVELATGKLLWSIPVRMRQNLTFELEDQWLYFEAIDEESQTQESNVSFHIVNTATGADTVVPWNADRFVEVLRTLVHRGRGVTPQGLVVKCEDGSVVGDLGSGIHQVAASNGKLYSMPFENPSMIAEREMFLLRRYDIETMQLEREIELKDRFPLTFVIAKGDVAVVRCQIDLRRSQLVCFNLETGAERWRVMIPNGVSTSKCEWLDDLRIALTTGPLGPIQPMHVNLENGEMTADLTWTDPRSLLAWHFNGSFFPDMFATDGERIVGRWRTQRLVCIDSKTGKEIWKHSNQNYPITRLFFQTPLMGKEIVAECDVGFDIISVGTPDGDRRRVIPDSIGLTKFVRSARNSNSTKPSNNSRRVSLSSTVSQDESIREWMKDWGTLLWPAIPLLFWVIWSLVRYWSPAPKPNKHIV